MKMVHKITSMLIATLITASVVSVTMVSATTKTEDPGKYSSHPNTSDVVWSGTVDWSRRKNDDSSVYVKNVSMYNNATVSVYGAPYGAPSVTDSVCYDPTYTSYHQTTNLTLPANHEREIYQFIWENNKYYAHIYFSGQASGRWSPDCAGSYKVLNP